MRLPQQFWRNTDDGDVIRFLKLFTELSMDKIHELEQLTGAGINEAKVCTLREIVYSACVASGQKCGVQRYKGVCCVWLAL